MKFYKGWFILSILFLLTGCFENIPSEPAPTEPVETIIETDDDETEEERIAQSNLVRSELVEAVHSFQILMENNPHQVSYSRQIGSLLVYQSNHYIMDSTIIQTVQTLQSESTQAFLKEDDVWVNYVQKGDFFNLGYGDLFIPELLDLHFSDATRYTKTDTGYQIHTTKSTLLQSDQDTLDDLMSFISHQGGQNDTPIVLHVQVYSNAINIKIHVVTSTFEIHEHYSFLLDFESPIQHQDVIRSDAKSIDEVRGYLNLSKKYDHPVSMTDDLYSRYHLEPSDYVIEVIYNDFYLMDAYGNPLELISSLDHGSRYAFSIQEAQDIYLVIGKTRFVFVNEAIYRIDPLDYEIGETFIEVEYTDREMHFDEGKEFHPMHISFVTEIAMVYILLTDHIDDIHGPEGFYSASFSNYNRIQFRPMEISEPFYIVLTKPLSFSLFLGNDDTLGATEMTPHVLSPIMSDGFIASQRFHADVFQLNITEAGLYTIETTGIFINVFIYNSMGTRITSPTSIFQLQTGTYKVIVESNFYQTYGIRYVKLN
jgi:hypothetical protein